MKLLDLFCGQGGAGMGYHRAGFDVTGVDIDPMPRYPFRFAQADAFEYLARHGHEYDAIHASPPCQGYTMLKNQHRNPWPRLIDPLRDLLRLHRMPWVIENVVGAPLLEPIVLCGEMFGLGVIRHRLFESNYELAAPAHVKHRGPVRGWRHGVYRDGPYVAVYGSGGGKATEAEAAAAMGIDWMTLDGLREAIPPAYAEWVGTQLLTACAEARSA